MSTDEVDKLVRAGAGWLGDPPGAGPDHPPLPAASPRADRGGAGAAGRGRRRRARAARQRRRRRSAATRPIEDRIRLLNQRRAAPCSAAVRACGARRVVDLGCGEGMPRAATCSPTARIERCRRRSTSPPAHCRSPRARLTPRPDDRAAARAHRALPVRTDLPRQAASPAFDAAGSGGGHRAPRPAAPGRARAERVRLRRARARSSSRRRTSSTTCGSRRCQPGRSATATTASSGHAREFQRLGGQRSPASYGYAGAVPAGRPRRPRGRAADADGACSAGRRMSATEPPAHPGTEPGRALIGAVRLGQVDVRARALRADRGDLRPTSAAASSPTTRTTSRRPRDAFDVLHYIAGQRLAAGRLTVVDATNVQRGRAQEPWSRSPASMTSCPSRSCSTARTRLRRAQRDAARPRLRGARAPQAARPAAPRHEGPQREGFRTVHVLRSEAEIAAAAVTRTRLFNDLRHVAGPFDVIGDIHGCRAELEALLGELGYTIERDGASRAIGARHPGRRAVFVGDLVDRGPDTPGVLRLVMAMVGRRRRALRARKPREQAAPRAPRPRRHS